MKTTHAIKVKGFHNIPKDGQACWFIDREITYIVTPNGMLGSLQNHNITDNGIVTPSVLVSDHEKEWHGMLKLKGWYPV